MIISLLGEGTVLRGARHPKMVSSSKSSPAFPVDWVHPNVSYSIL
jgi:hypothetical protein